MISFPSNIFREVVRLDEYNLTNEIIEKLKKELEETPKWRIFRRRKIKRDIELFENAIRK